jgi:preprotein translocase subunit SecD
MRRNTIVFVIMLVIFVLAAAIVFPIGGGLLGNRPVKLGLDLKGGVHIVYQADLTGIPEADRAAAMDADVTAINSRVDVFGVTNPIVQKQGTDRILVQLPGIADVEKAKAVIGQTAILEFGELASSDSDTAIKWTNEYGKWKPALGTVNGVE